MFVQTDTGLICSAQEMIAANPLTCPTIPLAPYDGYALLADVPAPAHNPAVQRIERAAHAVLTGGQWLPQYSVVALTPEERAAAEQAAAAAARITITRTQGLIYLWRELQVKESDVLALIAGMEDEGPRYEADLYFRAANWDSDNPCVGMFAAAVGLDTPQKREAAFTAAKAI